MVVVVEVVDREVVVVLVEENNRSVVMEKANYRIVEKKVGRCEAEVRPMRGRCEADVGPMWDRCEVKFLKKEEVNNTIVVVMS